MEALRFQRAADPEKRSITNALRTALVSSVALAAVLLSLLAAASGNNDLLERHYGLLLWLNVGIAVALVLLALEMARRLYQRYRKGLFGTRLMARLAISFILMTAVPVLLIYTVAVQFLGRSIESWFDVPMERALDSGLNLGRATLDSLLGDLSSRTRRAANELSQMSPSERLANLDAIREQYGVQEALLITSSGRVLRASGSQYLSLLPDLPNAATLNQARLMRHFAIVEAVDGVNPRSASPAQSTPSGQSTSGSQSIPPERNAPGARSAPPSSSPPSPIPAEPPDDERRSPGGGLKLRALNVLSGTAAGEEPRILQFLHPVPQALASNAEAVQDGFRDYQQLSLSRIGLKRIFRITLTVTVLLTIFSAIAAAFLLAGWMTGPLSMLAAGTRAVAEGDFRPVKDYAGRDELGVLTQSFNAMTRQLLDARRLVERNRVELERANARLASVLSNLSAGVLVMDRDLKITLANASAESILDARVQDMAGRPLSALPALASVVDALNEGVAEIDSEGPHTWQRQIAVNAPADDNDKRGSGKTLLLRGALLPDAQHEHLLVINDITDVVSAQRAIAWGEVARRLAHEIKNPLTPIQLAAERLSLKLADKLPPAERDMLNRNTRTIVNQVGALKVMVDEFRDYARLPPAKLLPLDLNELIQDVLALYADTDPGRTVNAWLAPQLPRIMGDAGQLRQVVHNLLKNASEATEKQAVRIVEVITEAVRTTSGGTVGVRLVVRDNGPGFPSSVLPRAFEPYVSNKVKGTGLGLAIVRKIVLDHGGRIDVGNRPEPFVIRPMSTAGASLPLFDDASAQQMTRTSPESARTVNSETKLQFGGHTPQEGATSEQKAQGSARARGADTASDEVAIGAYVVVLFAKLEKCDDNFSTPATNPSEDS